MLFHFFHVARGDRSVIPACQTENVTFSNHMHTSTVQVGISGDCELSANYSICSDPYSEVEGRVTSFSETDITFEIDSVETFYGNQVTVVFNDICDYCLERFYIPEMKPTG